MRSRRDDGMDGVGGEATECAWGVFLDTLILRIGAVGDGDALALVAPPGPEGLSRQLVITRPARPLSADNVEGMLRAFAQDLEQNRDELAYRLGGKAA